MSRDFCNLIMVFIDKVNLKLGEKSSAKINYIISMPVIITTFSALQVQITNKIFINLFSSNIF